MTTLQTGDDCQTNDLNNLFPIALESLRFPLDSSMRIIFTGYYNGFSVEVRSVDEISLLYHMGCFGKGSMSRSKPKVPAENSPTIMRKRQFLKRNYWCKKFHIREDTSESDAFFKEIEELTNDIIKCSNKNLRKDVIDLVSSEEENDGDDNLNSNNNVERLSFDTNDKHDLVVIVPDSESDGEDFFANLKPKCCVNKIKFDEILVLTLHEAYFLSYGLGCLQIVDSENKIMSTREAWDLFAATDDFFVTKYVVYHYFKSKGYVVKSGIKFGGDYLIYRDGPGINHADYIVVIKCEEKDETQNCVRFLGRVRMATTTAKEVLIVEVVRPKKTVKLPESLRDYTVKVMLISRKLPVFIDDEKSEIYTLKGVDINDD